MYKKSKNIKSILDDKDSLKKFIKNIDTTDPDQKINLEDFSVSLLKDINDLIEALLKETKNLTSNQIKKLTTLHKDTQEKSNALSKTSQLTESDKIFIKELDRLLQAAKSQTKTFQWQALNNEQIHYSKLVELLENKGASTELQTNLALRDLNNMLEHENFKKKQGIFSFSPTSSLENLSDYSKEIKLFVLYDRLKLIFNSTEFTFQNFLMVVKEKGFSECKNYLLKNKGEADYESLDVVVQKIIDNNLHHFNSWLNMYIQKDFYFNNKYFNDIAEYHKTLQSIKDDVEYKFYQHSLIDPKKGMFSQIYNKTFLLFSTEDKKTIQDFISKTVKIQIWGKSNKKIQDQISKNNTDLLNEAKQIYTLINKHILQDEAKDILPKNFTEIDQYKKAREQRLWDIIKKAAYFIDPLTSTPSFFIPILFVNKEKIASQAIDGQEFLNSFSDKIAQQLLGDNQRIFKIFFDQRVSYVDLYHLALFSNIHKESHITHNTIRDFIFAKGTTLDFTSFVKSVKIRLADNKVINNVQEISVLDYLNRQIQQLTEYNLIQTIKNIPTKQGTISTYFISPIAKSLSQDNLPQNNLDFQKTIQQLTDFVDFFKKLHGHNTDVDILNAFNNFQKNLGAISGLKITLPTSKNDKNVEYLKILFPNKDHSIAKTILEQFPNNETPESIWQTIAASTPLQSIGNLNNKFKDLDDALTIAQAPQNKYGDLLNKFTTVLQLNISDEISKGKFEYNKTQAETLFKNELTNNVFNPIKKEQSDFKNTMKDIQKEVEDFGGELKKIKENSITSSDKIQIKNIPTIKYIEEAYNKLQTKYDLSVKQILTQNQNLFNSTDYSFIAWNTPSQEFEFQNSITDYAQTTKYTNLQTVIENKAKEFYIDSLMGGQKQGLIKQLSGYLGDISGVNTATAENLKLQEENKKLKEENKKLKEENTEWELENQQTQQELRDEKVKNMTLKQEIVGLNSNTKSKDQEIQRTKDLLTLEKKKCQDQKDLYNQQLRANKINEQTITGHEKTIKDHEKTIQQNKTNYDDLQKQKQTLEETKNKICQEIQSLLGINQNFHDKQTLKQAFKQEIEPACLSKTISSLKAELQNVKSELEKICGVLKIPFDSNNLYQITDKARDIVQKNNIISSSGPAASGAVNTDAILQSQLVALRKENNDKDQIIVTKDVEISSLNNKLNDAKQKEMDPTKIAGMGLLCTGIGAIIMQILHKKQKKNSENQDNNPQGSEKSGEAR